VAANDSLVHVLVADDEPHIGRIIKMKLEAGPFRVTLAYDGRQALDVLEREPDVALVLLDLMMPHLSGLDVLAAIRSDPRWAKLPCIILTAAGQEAQHLRARELGVNEFLTKPFSPKRLYQRAAELVGISGEDGSAASA
jgi:two-component system, OmpR family, alkaline phosphatase synthesis response regulator PhoP